MELPDGLCECEADDTNASGTASRGCARCSVSLGAGLRVLVGATPEMNSPIKGKRALGLDATAPCHHWRSAEYEDMTCSLPRQWSASAGFSGYNFPRIHLKKLDWGAGAMG